MKHVIQFSGGLASAYVAWMCVEEFGKNNCILLFHETGVEHPDNVKFKENVCNFLEIEYVEISYGMDLWDLIVKQRCLPSYFQPFCTRMLKMEQGFKFLKKLKEKFIVYNGFGAHEPKRVMRANELGKRKGHTVHSPLYEQNIPDKKVMEIIRDEWNIKIQEPYMQGFEHCNCLPCFKGGQKHFKRVFQYYPEAFEKAKWAEKEISRIKQKEFTVFTREEKTGRWTYNSKGKKVIETETVKISLGELEKIWVEEPVKPQTMSFNHSDDWEQLDLFEVAA